MHTVNKNYKICTITSCIAVYHEHGMDGIALVGYKLYKFDLYCLFVVYQEPEQVICLVPELCSMTGLTDKARNDFRVMKVKIYSAHNMFTTVLVESVDYTCIWIAKPTCILRSK